MAALFVLYLSDPIRLKHLNSQKKLLYGLPVMLLLMAVSGYLYQRPYYNWDMFPYMALTAANSTSPFDSIHTLVYREAARVMQPQDYEAISMVQPIRFQDAAAFQEILKYYEIKPGYILVTRFFHFIGFNLVTSTYLPSIISYFLISCLLLWWLMKLLDSRLAVIITLLLAAMPFLLQTARYSSPDMLCALVLLSGLYLLSEVSIPYGLIVCCLAIPIRPDAVIIFLLMVFAAYKSNKLTLPYAVAFAMVGVSATIWMLGGVAILKEFLFTTPAYSEGLVATDLLKHYLLSVRTGINSLVNSQTSIFVVIAVVTLYIRVNSGFLPYEDLWSLLIAMATAAIFIRFLLHPAVQDRFNIASYLIIAVGLCQTIRLPTAIKSS